MPAAPGVVHSRFTALPGPCAADSQTSLDILMCSCSQADTPSLSWQRAKFDRLLMAAKEWPCTQFSCPRAGVSRLNSGFQPGPGALNHGLPSSPSFSRSSGYSWGCGWSAVDQQSVARRLPISAGGGDGGMPGVRRSRVSLRRVRPPFPPSPVFLFHGLSVTGGDQSSPHKDGVSSWAAAVFCFFCCASRRSDSMCTYVVLLSCTCKHGAMPRMAVSTVASVCQAIMRNTDECGHDSHISSHRRTPRARSHRRTLVL